MLEFIEQAPKAIQRLNSRLNKLEKVITDFIPELQPTIGALDWSDFLAQSHEMLPADIHQLLEKVRVRTFKRTAERGLLRLEAPPLVFSYLALHEVSLRKALEAVYSVDFKTIFKEA